MIRYLTAPALILASVCAHSAFAGVRAYHVGNSLTNQTTIHVGGTLGQLTVAAGIDYQWGRHIRCGSSLSNIVANPTDVCVAPIEPYGMFTNALSTYEWDVVTLQYYPGERQQERAAFSTLVDLALDNASNADAKYYLFSAWPQGVSSDSYSTRWDAAYDATLDSADKRWSRGFAATLLSEVRADHAATNINMIPVGEVLYELDQIARSRGIDSFDSVDEFYGEGDPYHLSTTGSYISRLTWFATMFGESPVGLPMPGNVALTSSDLALVQQTVWDVVTSNSDVTGVPEPSSLAVVALTAAALLRRRRQIL